MTREVVGAKEEDGLEDPTPGLGMVRWGTQRLGEQPLGLLLPLTITSQ